MELKPDIDHLRYAVSGRKRKRVKKTSSVPGNGKKRKTKHKIEEEDYGEDDDLGGDDDEELELNEDDQVSLQWMCLVLQLFGKQFNYLFT